MKKALLIISLLPLIVVAQNVGIGTSSPNSSAALHIESTNKGILVPKLALSSANSASPVTTPAEGLLVYNTNQNSQLNKGFHYWSGTSWEQIAANSTGAIPKNGIIEFESKLDIPGFTYIGRQVSEFLLKIGTGFGSWISLPTFPYNNFVRSPSYGYYNNRFFVWSGEDNSITSYEQTGAYYNPGTNTWTNMSLTNAPQGRFKNTTVVDNVNGRMFIWGGVTSKTNGGTVPVVSATGASYNMSLNNGWTPMASSPLTARYLHTAVYTGNRMIIWGGNDGNDNAFANGAYYNFGINAWSTIATSPLEARWGHSAIWTGSKMIIWGGTNGSTIFNNGAAYDPVTNTWSAIANMTILSPTFGHTVVWTGTEMITFGGESSFGPTTYCFKYNPSTNTWSSAAASPGNFLASMAVVDHSALWTGTEMLIIGGSNSFYNSGNGIVRAYNPATNSWALYNNAPGSYIAPAVAWTGTQFLVQGGYWGAHFGYRFDPNTGTAFDIEVTQNKTFYKFRKD